MIKKFYMFLYDHTIGVIRCLYLMPIIGVIFEDKNDVLFKTIILLCCAISLTIQLGHNKRWYEE